LLDVKFLAAHDANEAGTQPDFYYWAALLRSVSAFEIYRKVYRDVITPVRVAELMMLKANMPRSLVACLAEVVANLKEVSNDLSHDTERFAGKLHAELQFARIEDILEEGLHDYLVRFLECISELGNRVSSDFLVPPELESEQATAAETAAEKTAETAAEAAPAAEPVPKTVPPAPQEATQKTTAGTQTQVQKHATDRA
jgi:hypothetical protein